MSLLPIAGINPLPKQSLLEGCLSLYRYRGSLRRLIKDLKYQFISDLSPFLAKIMANDIHKNYPNLLSYWQNHHFVILPIPLHPHRQNWRGFNQSTLIAQPLSALLSLSFSDSILIRQTDTVSQTKLTKKSHRLTNVAHVFRITPNFDPSKNFIIFDDITTTHSTLLSAASTLSTAGCQTIWALTLAG